MSLFQPHQVRWIVRNLIDNEIPFVVIGGVAVQYYCPTRETADVDLFIGNDPIVIDRIVAGIPVLAKDPKAKSKLLDERVGHFRVEGEHKIDVLSFAPSLAFEEALVTAQTYESYGFTFPILSRSLLIDHKRAVGDPTDLEDVMLLETVKVEESGGRTEAPE